MAISGCIRYEQTSREGKVIGVVCINGTRDREVCTGSDAGVRTRTCVGGIWGPWSQCTSTGNPWIGDCDEDDDLDLVCNSNDVCPGGDDRIDSDTDGTPDFCDVCPGGDDSVDTDSDGVANLCDMCPNDNPDDDDNDNVCDGVDTCHGNNDTGDIDSDRLCGDLDDDDDDDGWSDAEEEACATDSADRTSVPVDANGDSVCDALYAIADTYVDQGNPDSNFGNEGRLRSDGSSTKAKHALLKFSIPFSVDLLHSALLRLYVGGNDGPTEDGPNVFVADNEWDELSVTWSSRPATVGPVIANVGIVEPNTWIELDVTRAIKRSGHISFILTPESTDGLFVFSNQASGHYPELVMAY